MDLNASEGTWELAEKGEAAALTGSCTNRILSIQESHQGASLPQLLTLDCLNVQVSVGQLPDWLRSCVLQVGSGGAQTGGPWSTDSSFFCLRASTTPLSMEGVCVPAAGPCV